MSPPVGKMKLAGWEIGVRRTLPFTLRQAWELIASKGGTRVWLGEPITLEPGREYRLADGSRRQVMVAAPGSHLRLSWQPADWGSPSIVQVRVIAAKTGTTISFHQEELPGPRERQAMLPRWTAALGDLEVLAWELDG